MKLKWIDVIGLTTIGALGYQAYLKHQEKKRKLQKQIEKVNKE